MKRLALVLSLFPLAAFADIEGFTLRLDKGDRDEPIESWVAFEAEDKVRYYRCRASATDCTRESKSEDIAEERTVTRDQWLAEVSRTYGLAARILLNPEASAKRIDASVEALRKLEADKDNATATERADAKTKLEQLTKRDGYRDRFQQASALAKALKKPMGEETNLVLEASDRRSYRTLWPFNFDERALTLTDKTVSGRDVVTGVRWTVLKDKKATWIEATAACEGAKAGAVPTADQVTASAAWLAVLLGPTAAAANPSRQARFWLSHGRVTKVEPAWNGKEPTPTATGVERKLYHWYEGRFDYFNLDGKLAAGGSSITEIPAEKEYPSFVQKWTTSGVIKQYDEAVEPKEEVTLARLGGKTSEYGVVCLEKRSAR